ncbi:hypothetical protein N9I19_19380 [Peribacillus sp. CSMR9]|nr:hypothetical protein [Peribacillus sp. CSMR9]
MCISFVSKMKKAEIFNEFEVTPVKQTTKKAKLPSGIDILSV